MFGPRTTKNTKEKHKLSTVVTAVITVVLSIPTKHSEQYGEKKKKKKHIKTNRITDRQTSSQEKSDRQTGQNEDKTNSRPTVKKTRHIKTDLQMDTQTIRKKQTNISNKKRHKQKHSIAVDVFYQFDFFSQAQHKKIERKLCAVRPKVAKAATVNFLILFRKSQNMSAETLTDVFLRTTHNHPPRLVR